MARSKKVAYLLAVALAAIIPHDSSLARENQAVADVVPPQVNFNADEVNHDQELGILIARGNVEVVYGERMLVADQISYNTGQDKISASGNVSIVEPTGQVYYAEYFELTSDFKEVVGTNLRILTADRSRIAAASMKRLDGNLTELDRAAYSPCEPCKKNPSRELLWQLKAHKIFHDQEKQQMEYRDAWMEVFGIPILYTPYISHPDPTVKKRSGFLPPTFGGGKSLGGSVTTPYFFNVSPDLDFTLSPRITGKEGVVLGGEYRQHFKNGKIITDGSITKDSQGEVRGHVNANGLFDIDETWRSGFLVERSTDDTYLRKYGYRSRPFLVTNPFIEGFNGRNYAKMQAYSYQGLRENDQPGITPLVLPYIEYNRVGDPNRYGGYWSSDSSVLLLERSKSTDTRRLAGNVAWHLPYTAPKGDVYNFTAKLRAEGYSVGDYNPEGGIEQRNGLAGRVIPEATLDWRYPFVRHGNYYSEIIEPIAVFTVSPYGMNDYAKIPNEDSQEFEFDDTNLFTSSRFAGLDRVEGGPRVSYGLKWTAFGGGSRSVSALFGQSYRVRSDQTFGVGSGLEDNLSDYVGRVTANPSQNLSLLYRFRLDKDYLNPWRNEIGFSIGPKSLRLTTDYINVRQKESSSEFPDREQLSLGLSSIIDNHWSLSLRTLHDLTPDGGPLAAGARLVYDDECFALVTDLTRNYTYDRDYVGGTSVVARIVFKNLGEAKTSYDRGF